ncbi:hypothetical protein ACLKA7_016694 [Drosophila subpalustris]
MTGPRLLLVTHASDIKYDNEDNNDNDVAQLRTTTTTCEGQRDEAVLGTGTTSSSSSYSLGTCVNCKATFTANWDGMALSNGNQQLATCNQQPTTCNWQICKLRLHNTTHNTCNLPPSCVTDRKLQPRSKSSCLIMWHDE